MRRMFLVLPVVLALTQAGCSYLTDFVVLNESANTVEVRYRLKDPSRDPLYWLGAPAKMPISQLREDNGWVKHELPAGQYRLDRESGALVVRLSAGEALRVQTVSGYRGHEHPGAADEFLIGEISLSGSAGELRLTGEQARKAFSEVSGTLYTLEYR